MNGIREALLTLRKGGMALLVAEQNQQVAAVADQVLVLAPGGSERAEAHARGTIEQLVLVRGRVAVEVDGETHELAERDAIVFGIARESRIPIAWNLAGGYQEPLRKVLDIHDRTMAACIAAHR